MTNENTGSKILADLRSINLNRLNYVSPDVVLRALIAKLGLFSFKFFRFCQSCGYKRRLLIFYQARTTNATLDVPALDNHSLQIASVSVRTSYAKQKSSLLSFLQFPFPKDIPTATPSDLCLFLVWKDQKGKRKYITPTANSSHARVCFLAHVQGVLPIQ